MKQLILVRHTKSSWKDESLADFDRPLKKSRLDDAFRVAEQLRKKKIVPSLVMASPSRRTMETAEIFCKSLQLKVDLIQTDPTLYESSEHELLASIKALPANIDTVMIFGHNPAFTNFVSHFTKGQINHIPTTGAVRLLFDRNDWKINFRSKAALDFFITPKKELVD
jgi:phosphohistidine phosphatase